MTKTELKKMEHLQGIIGKAQGVYANDRRQDRADRLIPLLEEAFNVCVAMRSKYPQEADDES